LEHFKATPEAQKALESLLLSARVKLALIDVKPDAEIFDANGTIVIKARTSQFEDEQLIQKIEEIAKSVPGVINIRVDLVSYTHG
jgi:hypothetical protein